MTRSMRASSTRVAASCTSQPLGRRAARVPASSHHRPLADHLVQRGAHGRPRGPPAAGVEQLRVFPARRHRTTACALTWCSGNSASTRPSTCWTSPAAPRALRSSWTAWSMGTEGARRCAWRSPWVPTKVGASGPPCGRHTARRRAARGQLSGARGAPASRGVSGGGGCACWWASAGLEPCVVLDGTLVEGLATGSAHSWWAPTA